MEALVQALKLAHALDLIIIGVTLGLAVFGFSKGTLKLAMVSVAVLTGFILASIFYIPFARLIAPFFNLQPDTRQADQLVAYPISFFVVNLIIALLLSFLLFSFWGHIEIRGRLGGCVDKPMGMLLGFMAGLLIAGILVSLISIPYEIAQTYTVPPQGRVGEILHDWYADSFLAKPVRTQIMPYFMALLQPAMLGGVPPILTPPTS
jgi:uncharacterized membrane protein required for colicin V production